MENKNNYNWIIILGVILYPISLFLNIPLSLALNQETKFWIQFFLCLFFVWTLYKNLFQEKGKQTIVQLLVLTTALVIYLNDYDKRIFMGETIASSYTADIPGGHTHLELFNNNKCRINFGLISSETHFGEYKIIEDTVFCYLDCGLIELENNKIEINNQYFILKSSNK